MMHGMKHKVVEIMNLAVAIVMLSAQGWTWYV
jgi:hypothetical protein